MANYVFGLSRLLTKPLGASTHNKKQLGSMVLALYTNSVAGASHGEMKIVAQFLLFFVSYFLHFELLPCES